MRLLKVLSLFAALALLGGAVLEDVLFGTFYRPRGEETWEAGLGEPEPGGYVAQLVRPFGTLEPAIIGAVLLLVA